MRDRSVDVARLDQVDEPAVDLARSEGDLVGVGVALHRRPVVDLDDVLQQAPEHAQGLVPREVDELLVEAGGVDGVGGRVVHEAQPFLVALAQSPDRLGWTPLGQAAHGVGLERLAGLEQVAEGRSLDLQEQRRVPGGDADVGAPDPCPAAGTALDGDERFALDDAERLAHHRS